MPMLLMLLVPPFWPSLWWKVVDPVDPILQLRWTFGDHQTSGELADTGSLVINAQQNVALSHLGMSRPKLVTWSDEFAWERNLLSDFVCEPRKPRAGSWKSWIISLRISTLNFLLSVVPSNAITTFHYVSSDLQGELWLCQQLIQPGGSCWYCETSLPGWRPSNVHVASWVAQPSTPRGVDPKVFRSPDSI